ncbi:MAG: kelch repeat-containing protein [Polyangiaceae bacterium]
MRKLFETVVLGGTLTIACSDPNQGVASAPDSGLPTADAQVDATDAAPDAPTTVDPAGFRVTGALWHARSAHTATLLDDGRVLVVGGESVTTRSPLASVELYDPVTESWTEGPTLPEARSNHVAVKLSDGRVLVAGGGISAPIGVPKGEGVLASALLYDPVSNSWTPTGEMHEARSHFAALRLPSGNVLVAGGGAGTHDHGSTCNGYGVTDCGPIGDALASAEIYDTSKGTFAPTGPLASARYSFTLDAASGADALAVGGANDFKESFASTERFDEASGVWSPGPALASADRLFHSAAPLPSGRLLVGGGKKSNTAMLNSAVWVDVKGMSSELTGSLGTAHTVGAFVPLASGHVLSVGGFTCPNPCAPIALAEIYDEASGAWTGIGALATDRAGHSATRLKDGRVLVVGGFSAAGNLTSCEVTE